MPISPEDLTVHFTSTLMALIRTALEIKLASGEREGMTAAWLEPQLACCSAVLKPQQCQARWKSHFHSVHPKYERAPGTGSRGESRALSCLWSAISWLRRCAELWPSQLSWEPHACPVIHMSFCTSLCDYSSMREKKKQTTVLLSACGEAVTQSTPSCPEIKCYYLSAYSGIYFTSQLNTAR